MGDSRFSQLRGDGLERITWPVSRGTKWPPARDQRGPSVEGVWRRPMGKAGEHPRPSCSVKQTRLSGGGRPPLL